MQTAAVRSQAAFTISPRDSASTAKPRAPRAAIPPQASGHLGEQDAPVRAETDGGTVANGLELVGRDGQGGGENRDLDLELRKLVGVYRKEAGIPGCGCR